MKGFDVLKIKSAVKQHNKFDLSRSHLTTANFGQIIPLFCEETVPGDKFNVSAEYFSRLAPLVKPTYGKFSFKTVSAFVPYHQVAYDSDAWLAGKTTWEGVTPIQRCVRMGDLFAFFRDYCSTTVVGGSYDFCFQSGANTVTYKQLSESGRYYLKVLNALGYNLPENVSTTQTSVYITSGYYNIKLSAYPLLAYFKLYNDYMSQSQRFNTSALSAFLNAVKYNKSVTGYDPATGLIDKDGLKILFDNLVLNYENDYFTSAWQSPNNALGVGESINNISVPSTFGSAAVGHFNSDTGLTQSNGSSGGGTTLTIGQRALEFLKSFDDWVRRNNYSGSRSVQQIYSRFGIKTDDYRSHYANVITTDSMPIQVGDVTATADTTNAELGEYAGKGIMTGNNGFSVSVSDYGMVFVLGYFTVVPMMSYGFDRRVLRNTPLDYYNPEFDGLGADAIPLMEVFESPIEDPLSDPSIGTSVFGFTERYNSYRFGRDVITGDFRHYGLDFMNCWHTGRLLGDVRTSGNLVAQSSTINTLSPVQSEYNRMFATITGTVDHFYLTCRFKVDAIRPMLNLNSATRLGEGDTLVPRNGNVIS